MKFILILVISLYLFSCGDSINAEREIDANYLVSSQVFQQYVSDHEALMAPLTKHLHKLAYNEVVELEDSLFEEFELIEESKNKAVENDIHLNNIIKLLGYDSFDQYNQLVEDMNSSLSVVLETYPELNNFHKFEPHSEMEIAMGQLINDKPNSNELIEIDKRAFLQIKSIDLEIENSTCENNEGLSECLSEARRTFHWVTAACAAGGAASGFGTTVLTWGNPVIGASTGLLSFSACQAVNVLWYHDNQQICITGNC